MGTENREDGDGASNSGGGPCRHLDRRTFLTAAATSAVGAAGASAAERPGGLRRTGGEWPMFQRDPANSGALGSPPGPAGVSLRWLHTSLGNPARTPAVVDGTVYLPHDGRLEAYSLADGSRAWSSAFVPPEDGLLNSPAVAGGRVFLPGANLYAVDAADGSHEWTVRADGTASAPTVVDGTVFATVGARLYAADAETGVVSWSRAFGTRARWAAPAVADGTVFVLVDGALHALDADSGTRVWRRPVGYSVGTVSVADGDVYAVTRPDTSTVHVSALRADDGSVRWRREFAAESEWTVSPLATANGRLHFLVGGYGTQPDDWPHGLYALDRRTGSREWVTEAAATGEWPPPPIVVGDVVLAGDEGGTLRAVDAGTGDVRWEQSLDSRVNPVAAGEALVVSATPNEGETYATDGELFAFDFEFG